MKKCPYCAEDIQDAAIVCKHCGRDIVIGAQSATVAATPETARKKKSHPMLWLLGIIGTLLVIALFTPQPPRSSRGGTNAQGDSRALNISIAWNAVAIRITNKGDAEAAGKPMTVYVNGTPPFTYRADSQVPAVGQTVQLQLIDFAKKDGERFNPLTRALTVIWVGGDGYNYASYKVR